MVTWFIGLSRSGKSTLSKILYDKLKLKVDNLILIDGDIIRNIFGNDLGHTIEDRRENARRISQLTKFLADQNIHVIAAVLSIFPEWQKWNRENIKNYSEIYLKVPMEVLKQRDKNGLYIEAEKGNIKNVVGVDIPFPEPIHSDLIIDNDRNDHNYEKMISKVLELEKIKNI
tara:strand:- start:1729 stop:2244 length:516 start_codon:yes stop_codon:yes gene_type:complete